MNLTYDRASLLQGNKIRKENEERPVTFAEYNGAVDAEPTQNLDQTQQRMAGPVGARAMQLMNDPVAQDATNNWMELFGQSNQGTEFNASKQAQATEAATTEVMTQIADKEARG